MSSDTLDLRKISNLLENPEFAETFDDWSNICKDVPHNQTMVLYKLIARFPKESWDWEYLSNRYFGDVFNYLSFDTIVLIGSSHRELNFPWSFLTCKFSEYYGLEEFIKTKHLPWDWKELSFQVLNKIDLVKSNLDLSWDWTEISSKVTHIDQFDIVKSNVDLPWNWDVLSENMNKQIIGRIVPLSDHPSGYFIIDNFGKFLENYHNLRWNYSILMNKLSKEKNDKIELKNWD